MIATTTKPSADRVYIPMQSAPDAETLNEKIMSATGDIKCVMGVVNGAAWRATYQAIEALKEDGLLKGKVKQLINKADRAHEEYETNLKWANIQGAVDFFAPSEHVKERVTREDLFGWFLDIGLCSYDRNAPAAEKVRMAILQAFTKRELPHRAALSYASVAFMMTQYACQTYDQLIKELNERDGLKFDRLFTPFRMSGVAHYIAAATRALGATADVGDDVIDLNAEKEVMTAWHAYENAIILDLHTYASANAAIDENKEMLGKKKYREYRLAYDAEHAEYMRKNYGVIKD